MDNKTDIEILQELGWRVRRIRLKKNIRQEELADKAGVSVGTVKNLESGRGVSLRSFLAIVRVLGRLKDLSLLLDSPAISPIEVAKLKGKARKRARASGA